MTITPEHAISLVAPFYDALNCPAEKDVAALVQRSTSAAWRSYAGEDVSKNRDAFIQQVIGFGKLIPNLTWTINEILVAGDRIIVRSAATGTPTGVFFGVPHSGGTFQIMTIDIHTVQDGILVTAYHIEDWATAMRQLSTH